MSGGPHKVKVASQLLCAHGGGGTAVVLIEGDGDLGHGCLTTGINRHEEKIPNGVQINTIGDNISITFPVERTYRLSVLDVNGKTVLAHDSAKQYSFSKKILHPGIYVVRITGPEGGFQKKLFVLK